LNVSMQTCLTIIN